MPRVKIGTAYGVTVEIEANEMSTDELRKQAMDSFEKAHAVAHKDPESTSKIGFAPVKAGGE